MKNNFVLSFVNFRALNDRWAFQRSHQIRWAYLHTHNIKQISRNDIEMVDMTNNTSPTITTCSSPPTTHRQPFVCIQRNKFFLASDIEGLLKMGFDGSSSAKFPCVYCTIPHKDIKLPPRMLTIAPTYKYHILNACIILCCVFE